MDWTRLPLARATIDRLAERRTDPGLVADAWSAPTTRALLVHGSDLATVAGPALDLVHPTALGPTPDGLVLFCGADDDGDLLAVVRPDPDPARQWSGLREVGHLLGDRDAGLATLAVGLAAWHERHPCCARCGAPTAPALGGWTRRCPQDGSEHYPRTDPAVIMAVVDADERVLLAHGATWAPGRFSTLAGYVEPGESAEHAVRREVAEETGVQVTDVVYRGSQPWPFPASLMLAFTARATSTAITVDAVEVTDARWFGRAELAAAVAAGEVGLPSRASVARALLEEWYGGPLPSPSRPGNAPR